ncbi:transposase [Tsuneonella suprasediminis]|uniref:transposase n=1 Tax=Tsuneonella suprasediminis TaxID=2306996 RepID=UPI003B835544
MSDEEAYEIFLQARWKDGVPKCPECDSEAWTLGDHSRPGDKRWFRCKSNPVRKEFSVTSRTLFPTPEEGFGDDPDDHASCQRINRILSRFSDFRV